jgi:hypothetical protein
MVTYPFREFRKPTEPSEGAVFLTRRIFVALRKRSRDRYRIGRFLEFALFQRSKSDPAQTGDVGTRVG